MCRSASLLPPLGADLVQGRVLGLIPQCCPLWGFVFRIVYRTCGGLVLTKLERKRLKEYIFMLVLNLDASVLGPGLC